LELDDVVDLAELEFAALDFARRALGELIAAAVDTRTAERFYAVSGWPGFPLADDEQAEARSSCTRCESRRGFRRRRWRGTCHVGARVPVGDQLGHLWPLDPQGAGLPAERGDAGSRSRHRRPHDQGVCNPVELRGRSVRRRSSVIPAK